MILQGEICRADLAPPSGSEPGFRRPVVVIQNDLTNHSRIGTVIVCALTSNLWLARAPGNLLPEKGEGRLARASVVNVGRLPVTRVHQILNGVQRLLEPREVPRD